MEFYIAIQGQRQGPMSLEDIQGQLDNGRILPESTLAWHEGCPEWIPLAQVPGIHLPAGGAAEPPPIPSASASSAGGLANGPRGTAPGDGSPHVLSSVIPYRNPMALVAYYLGIFSLIPTLGLLLAVPAIILGVLGLGRSRRNAQAKGKTHAWVGIATGLLSIVGHGVGLVMLRS